MTIQYLFRWAAACFAAVSLLFAGPPVDEASAFNLTGRSWFQVVRGDPVTLTYSYSNYFDGGLVDSHNQPVPEWQLRSAIEEALSLWASVAPLHFVEVADDGRAVNDSLYGPGQYGTIRIGHHPIDGFGNTKAHAYFPPFSALPENDPCTLCGDVHFDTGDRWELIGTLAFPDLLGGAIHELGHSLGLNHSSVSHQLDVVPPIFDGANMFPTFRRASGPGTGVLHPDDIAGIQAIYGAGVGSVTPLRAVPEPTAIGLLAVLAAGLVCMHRASHCRHCTRRFARV